MQTFFCQGKTLPVEKKKQLPMESFQTKVVVCGEGGKGEGKFLFLFNNIFERTFGQYIMSNIYNTGNGPRLENKKVK